MTQMPNAECRMQNALNATGICILHSAFCILREGRP